MAVRSKGGDLGDLVAASVDAATPGHLREHRPGSLLLPDQVVLVAASEAALEAHVVGVFEADSAAVTEEDLAEEEGESATKAVVALGEEVGTVVLPTAALPMGLAVLYLPQMHLLDLAATAAVLVGVSLARLSMEA